MQTELQVFLSPVKFHYVVHYFLFATLVFWLFDYFIALWFRSKWDMQRMWKVSAKAFLTVPSQDLPGEALENFSQDGRPSGSSPVSFQSLRRYRLDHEGWVIFLLTWEIDIVRIFITLWALGNYGSSRDRVGERK